MTFNVMLSLFAAVLCGGLAVFVFFKEKRSFVHLTFTAGMLAFAVEAVLNGLSFATPLPLEIASWQRARLIAASFVPVGWLLFSLSFGRASYRQIIEKWRWPIPIILLIPVVLVTLFGSSLFRDITVLDLSYGWAIGLGWSGYFFYLASLLSAALIIMNLERTLRNSSGSIRWQIKFMVLGLGGIFAIRIYTSSQALLFQSLESSSESINLGALILCNLLIVWSLLRLRLLNVDIYPSHSLIYNSITIVVIGIYLILVGILAKLADYLNISHGLLIEGLLIFLSLLGLTIILLSNTLRQEIRRFVSLHFKRPKYDYRSIWASFTKSTSSIIDLKQLCSAVTKMTARTFGVACATIWLFDETQKNLILGGSTVFSPGRGELEGVTESARVLEICIRTMGSEEAPIDFKESERDWVTEIKRSHVEFFRNARVRYCVSLLSGRELLGVMTLDDKITGETFSIEDLDLLKSIADQAAGAISNIRMSEHLRRAKEMEAFQTMSAFFVHDLKNLASRLSLTMQNLPVHFDNPEFRKDALHAISDSVNKMNTICSGLSFLRQGIVLQRAETDLNELVKNTVGSLNGFNDQIALDLKRISKSFVDPDQICRVLTNLILNAHEAVDKKGEIRIATEQKENSAVISVCDNGCGMSKEFMEKALFRPFKTTKKQGMGIGLYHCKMVIEAHQGKIEAESQEGKGTTFRVILPIKHTLRVASYELRGEKK